MREGKELTRVGGGGDFFGDEREDIFLNFKMKERERAERVMTDEYE